MLTFLAWIDREDLSLTLAYCQGWWVADLDTPQTWFSLESSGVPVKTGRTAMKAVEALRLGIQGRTITERPPRGAPCREVLVPSVFLPEPTDV